MFICTRQVFPTDRDRFISMIFSVFWDNVLLFSQKFSETIDNGNCAHGELRCWKSNVLTDQIKTEIKQKERDV